ncbi:MAG: hypothetical protein IKV41_02780 [Oscillospiraceae bacterium]|nr:hypothetical protein [Oscillospiraceae bacterium]
MAYTVSLVEGSVDFTALPIVKITEYPFEKGIYRPYAHGAACISDGWLWVRMLAFEAISIENSKIAAAFSLPESKKLLVIQADETSGSAVCRNENGEETAVCAEYRFFKGEDLQGKYWGVQARIKLDDIADVLPKEKLKAGACIYGNYFKVCETKPYVHYGSAFPYAFDKTQLNEQNGMAEFVIADY